MTETYRDAVFVSTDSHVTEPIELYADRVDTGSATGCRASRPSASGAAW